MKNRVQLVFAFTLPFVLFGALLGGFLVAGCAAKEVPDEKLLKPGEILNTVPPNAKGSRKGD